MFVSRWPLGPHSGPAVTEAYYTRWGLRFFPTLNVQDLVRAAALLSLFLNRFALASTLEAEILTWQKWLHSSCFGMPRILFLALPCVPCVMWLEQSIQSLWIFKWVIIIKLAPTLSTSTAQWWKSLSDNTCVSSRWILTLYSIRSSV